MHEKGMSELFAKDSYLCKNIAVLKREHGRVEVATLLHIVGFPGPRPAKEPAHRQEDSPNLPICCSSNQYAVTKRNLPPIVCLNLSEQCQG